MGDMSHPLYLSSAAVVMLLSTLRSSCPLFVQQIGWLRFPFDMKIADDGVTGGGKLAISTISGVCEVS
jgi:hypothetical protein